MTDHNRLIGAFFLKTAVLPDLNHSAGRQRLDCSLMHRADPLSSAAADNNPVCIHDINIVWDVHHHFIHDLLGLILGKLEQFYILLRQMGR
ncbi:hypothetical protein D3C73_1313410 [compost metagenome]